MATEISHPLITQCQGKASKGSKTKVPKQNKKKVWQKLRVCTIKFLTTGKRVSVKNFSKPSRAPHFTGEGQNHKQFLLQGVNHCEFQCTNSSENALRKKDFPSKGYIKKELGGASYSSKAPDDREGDREQEVLFSKKKKNLDFLKQVGRTRGEEKK